MGGYPPIQGRGPARRSRADMLDRSKSRALRCIACKQTWQIHAQHSETRTMICGAPRGSDARASNGAHSAPTTRARRDAQTRQCCSALPAATTRAQGRNFASSALPGRVRVRRARRGGKGAPGWRDRDYAHLPCNLGSSAADYLARVTAFPPSREMPTAMFVPIIRSLV